MRKISPSGIITTYAGTGVSGDSGDGGPATAATFTGILGGLAFDPDWNLYIADRDANKIRKVNRISGNIETYAGTGSSSYAGDGIPATAASFYVYGINTDAAGNLFIADHINERVYEIDLFGIFHAIAGTGIAGYNGDSILATAAQLDGPWGVATDKCGNLYIADAYNYRVRKVTIPPTAPNITLISNHGDSVCTGSMDTFHVVVSGGTPGSAAGYAWYVNGMAATGGAGSYAYTPADGDSVRCVVTYVTRCGDTFVVSSNTLHMSVLSALTPVVSLSGLTYVSVGSVVTVTAAVSGAGGAYTLHWYDNDSLTGTTTGTVFTYTKTRAIDSITATLVPATTGCYDSVASGLHLVVDSVLGLSSLPPAGGALWLWPNPAGDVVHVACGIRISTLVVTDLVGRTVLQQPAAGNTATLNISSLEAGFYFVKVNGVMTGRFLKR